MNDLRPLTKEEKEKILNLPDDLFPWVKDLSGNLRNKNYLELNMDKNFWISTQSSLERHEIELEPKFNFIEHFDIPKVYYVTDKNLIVYKTFMIDGKIFSEPAEIPPNSFFKCDLCLKQMKSSQDRYRCLTCTDKDFCGKCYYVIENSSILKETSLQCKSHNFKKYNKII